MKLKKMITVCRKDGVLAVADDDSSGRWIGNVRFWWSGELYSGMSAEDICMVNDISRKQIDNMRLYDNEELPEWKDTETAEAEEVRLAGYEIVFGGERNSRAVYGRRSVSSSGRGRTRAVERT